MHEALYQSAESGMKVRCHLCPHLCLMAEGKSGICRVRYNREGTLYTSVYGRVAAMHSDPIEKKPLYHFFPGSEILSIGTPGCNLHCSFCQNYHLSHPGRSDSVRQLAITPVGIVEKAAGIQGNTGIAYTYNEPTVFFEMMLDTATLAKDMGLKNIVVSNGFISQKPLEELLTVTDAYNIDLKAFDDDFYKKIAGGKLSPVLDTLKTIYSSGRHLEITFLVIPTLNDSLTQFIQMTEWISTELSADVPLHLSRYFPAWKMDLPPTPVPLLQKMARTARQNLNYVYMGNVAGDNYSSTLCTMCGQPVIERSGYSVRITGLTDSGTCTQCGSPVPIVMQ